MPGAVPRNRLRRRLRAASRGILAERGYDLIVTATPMALTVSFAELQEHVDRAAAAALERLGKKVAVHSAAPATQPGPGSGIADGGGEVG
jgi:RNase P protein component